MKSFTFQCKTPFFRMMSFLTLSLPLVLLMGLFSGQALAVCFESTFEDDDGNLIFEEDCADDPQSPTASQLDWNSFAPTVDWTGSAPDRVGTATELGWTFVGVEDAKVSSSDIGFVGGTKQDDECASVTTAKALNKGDLERIYLSTNTVGTDIFLNLGWVRIPQNSTSASAHVAFEFNKGDPVADACPEGSDGLVQRTAGDMLIVYDFEGGSADPIIKLARWTEDAACDVASNSPPCWGVATELTSIGAAEAAVNVGTSVSDAIGPDGSDTLGVVEFGEAGINLTEAGVFADGQCESFGSAFAVSRSSGNSGTAQMKDLVGPTPFELDNCGKIKIVKETFGGDGTFGFSFSGLDLTDVTTTGGSSVTSNSFDLATTSNTGTFTISEVPVGTYTVEEVGAASGFSFKDLVCEDDSDGGSNNVITSSPSTLSTATPPIATIKVDLKEEVTCTFRNEQAALKVTKSVVNACDASDPGKFNLLIDNSALAGPGGDATDVGNGGDTGFVTVSTGLHTVSETAGTNTSLSDYVATIGGNCASGGTVTLAGGSSATCSIENVRKPTVTINKVVVGDTTDTFDLLIANSVEANGVGDEGSTGAVTISAPYNGTTKLFGPVTLSETLAGGDTVPETFNIFWTCDNVNGTTSGSGDSIEIGPLEAGEDVSCTVVNTVIQSNSCIVSP